MAKFKRETIKIPGTQFTISWDVNSNLESNIKDNLGEHIKNHPNSAEKVKSITSLYGKTNSEHYIPNAIVNLLKDLHSHDRLGQPNYLYHLLQFALHQYRNNLYNEMLQQQDLVKSLSENYLTQKTNLENLKNEESVKTRHKAHLEQHIKTVKRIESTLKASIDDQQKQLPAEIESAKREFEYTTKKVLSENQATRALEDETEAFKQEHDVLTKDKKQLALDVDPITEYQKINADNKKYLESIKKSVMLLRQALSKPFFGKQKSDSDDKSIVQPMPNRDKSSGGNKPLTCETIDKKSYFWQEDDTIAANLERELNRYLNDGQYHSLGRKQSAKQILAKIAELNKEPDNADLNDKKLIDYIRQHQVPSHGLDRQSSVLHALYQHADKFHQHQVATKYQNFRDKNNGTKEHIKKLKNEASSTKEEIKKLDFDIQRLENELNTTQNNVNELLVINRQMEDKRQELRFFRQAKLHNIAERLGSHKVEELQNELQSINRKTDQITQDLDELRLSVADNTKNITHDDVMAQVQALNHYNEARYLSTEHGNQVGSPLRAMSEQDPSEVIDAKLKLKLVLTNNIDVATKSSTANAAEDKADKRKSLGSNF